MSGDSVVDRIERGCDDVYAQDHSGPAAVRVVVDLARGERRRVPVVEQAELELVAEHCGERALLRQPRERVRDLSEDVELQRKPRQVTRHR